MRKHFFKNLVGEILLPTLSKFFIFFVTALLINYKSVGINGPWLLTLITAHLTIFLILGLKKKGSKSWSVFISFTFLSSPPPRWARRRRPRTATGTWPAPPSWPRCPSPAWSVSCTSAPIPLWQSGAGTSGPSCPPAATAQRREEKRWCDVGTKGKKRRRYHGQADDKQNENKLLHLQMMLFNS